VLLGVCKKIISGPTRNPTLSPNTWGVEPLCLFDIARPERNMI
jgi:hypothetical protein